MSRLLKKFKSIPIQGYSTWKTITQRGLNTYESIKFSTKGKVALIELARPSTLNALSLSLINELKEALEEVEQNSDLSVAVLTGDGKCFAAGADIEEMSNKTFLECHNENFLSVWDSMFRNLRKPIIAAVNGYALGGGCELAMMCDIIYAGENAKFAQPEIKLGTIPGGGGTQRLPRIIGKSKAMEMVLTGKHISAKEAESFGLVSKVYPTDKVVEEALTTAEKISKYSLPALRMCKDAVNKAFEATLSNGLEYERQLFHATFSLKDQKEGMEAFLGKRAPEFKNE